MSGQHAHVKNSTFRAGTVKTVCVLSPVNLIDVAGLVPDAHKGKGLGNQFLDHLRQADAILHIIDASGGTDSEGNPVGVGNHNPEEDIEFLGFEMTMWVYGILRETLDTFEPPSPREKGLPSSRR